MTWGALVLPALAPLAALLAALLAATVLLVRRGGTQRWKDGEGRSTASASALPDRSQPVPGSFVEALGAAGLSEVDVARATGESRELLALRERIHGGRTQDPQTGAER
ncbi:MAG: hypothetical protein EA421_01500 [Gemmatimonadales bacterium]|nr:MAG: hypothetical protein EA421_01500 [Gemmatimonadales bacterium]